jgi:putative transposase
MHYINGSYTTYFNVKRGRTGHLFQGRYKSLVIDADNYFQKLTRYIHLNPVKAKMVEKPEDYEWSSYNAYVDSKREDKYIDKEEIHKYLAMSRKDYKFFVLNGMSVGEKEDDIFKDVYGGFLLGKTQFIKEKLKELKMQVESDKISYSRELRFVMEPGEIIEKVAKRFKKNPQDLIDSKTRPALEKQIAIYLIRRYTGIANGDIGKIFNMKAQAVSKAGIKIEKLIKENGKIRNQINKLISTFEG